MKFSIIAATLALACTAIAAPTDGGDVQLDKRQRTNVGNQAANVNQGGVQGGGALVFVDRFGRITTVNINENNAAAVQQILQQNK
jgi:hypothetical protein